MSATPALNVQKLKLLLVPVLALTLGAVLFWPTAEEDAAEEAVAAVIRPISQATAPGATAPNAELWKNVDLSKVGETNPFVVLQSQSTAESGDSQASTAEAATASAIEPSVKRITRSVLAVVQRDGKAYACIDDEVATVGDTLADGARVISITAEAVVLETAH